MGIVNRHIADNAEIDSLKLDFAVTSDPTVDADSSALTEGRLIYNTTDDALKVHDGTNFINIAQASANTGDLDDALQLGPKGLRPLEIEYSNASAKCMVLDQNGNGGCLTLENAGTGTDITAAAWNVTVGGLGTFTGLDLVDAKAIRLGASQDAVLQFDGTTLILATATDDVVFEIGDSAATQLSWDVKWYGNAGSGADYLYFDASANLIYTTGVDLQFLDDDVLAFGTGAGGAGDASIVHDGTNLIFKATADDELIEIGDSAATQLSFDIKWAGNGANAADYVYFDASANLVYTTGIDLQFIDNDFLVFGTGAGAAGDVSFTFNATQLVVATQTDNIAIYVGDGTKDLDLRWYGGDVNHYINFDCDGGTYGIWDFGKDANGIDVRFYGDTSGAYARWDETNNMMVFVGGAQLSLNDSVELLIGTGVTSAGDFMIYGSATPSLIINSVVAETGTVEIGADNLGLDVTVFSATASAGFIFDASADQLRALAGSSVNVVDDGEIRFGTGASAGAGDLKLSSNSSNVLQLEQVVSTAGTFEIGVDNVGIDVKFYAEAASAYMLWDEDGNTNGELVFVGVDAHFGDDDQIAFGAARDAVLDWDTVLATDSLVLDCAADDSVFVLGDGTTCWDVKWYAGAAGVYMEWDASGAIINIGLDDNGIDAKFFGDTASFYQMWDASGDEWLCSAGATPSYIRLPVSTLAQHDAISATGTEGQICYMSNGAAGAACLAFSDGANWLRADTLAACAAA